MARLRAMGAEAAMNQLGLYFWSAISSTWWRFMAPVWHQGWPADWAWNVWLTLMGKEFGAEEAMREWPK